MPAPHSADIDRAERVSRPLRMHMLVSRQHPAIVSPGEHQPQAATHTHRDGVASVLATAGG
jgi:hypothetical protein